MGLGSRRRNPETRSYQIPRNLFGPRLFGDDAVPVDGLQCRVDLPGVFQRTDRDRDAYVRTPVAPRVLLGPGAGADRRIGILGVDGKALTADGPGFDPGVQVTFKTAVVDELAGLGPGDQIDRATAPVITLRQDLGLKGRGALRFLETVRRGITRADGKIDSRVRSGSNWPLDWDGQMTGQ